MSNQLMQDQSNDFKNEYLSSSKEGGGVPSGFVLKLYQMVNNAPDEVISVRGKYLRLLSFSSVKRAKAFFRIVGTEPMKIQY